MVRGSHGCHVPLPPFRGCGAGAFAGTTGAACWPARRSLVPAYPLRWLPYPGAEGGRFAAVCGACPRFANQPNPTFLNKSKNIQTHSNK